MSLNVQESCENEHVLVTHSLGVCERDTSAYAQECDNRAALRASTEGLPVIARRFKCLHDARVVKVSKMSLHSK